jgi:predicted RND superfamily exporter protein
LIFLVVIDFGGLMGLLKIPRSVLSSIVPVLQIVVVGSYIVHLFRRVYEEAEEHAWKEAVQRAVARTTGVAIALAAATSATGFATLSVFQIYSVREFGLLAALGVLLAGLLSLTWLPAALIVFGKRSPREALAGRRPYLAVIQLITEAAVRVSSHGRVAWSIAAALGFLAVFGISQLRVGSNPAEFFPEGHQVRRDFEAMLQQFHGNGFLFVELTAPSGSTVYDPAFMRRVASFQATAEGVERVAYASSIVDRVLMRINRKMNGDTPEFERVPESAMLATQYAEFYRWGAPDSLGEMVEDSDEPRRLVVDVFADVNDSAYIAEIVRQLQHSLAKHFAIRSEGSAILGGEFVLWTAQNRYIVLGKILNILLSIGIVGLVCTVALGSWRSAFASVTPAALAVVFVLGLMPVVGIRLDLASCVITGIVVGIGVDFAIHLLLRHREIEAEGASTRCVTEVREETLRRAAPPVLYDALSNIVAFSVCVWSQLVPVRNFGWLISLSMMICAAATLFLLPALLPHSRSGEAAAPVDY